MGAVDDTVDGALDHAAKLRGGSTEAKVRQGGGMPTKGAPRDSSLARGTSSVRTLPFEAVAQFEAVAESPGWWEDPLPGPGEVDLGELRFLR